MYQTLPKTAERRSLNDTNNNSKTKSRPNITLQVQEAVVQECSVEKVFLEISPN